MLQAAASPARHTALPTGLTLFVPSLPTRCRCHPAPKTPWQSQFLHERSSLAESLGDLSGSAADNVE